MKKLLRILGGLVAILAVVWLAGPRVSTEIGSDPVPIPRDIDAWLEYEETQWGDLRAGTQKAVRWQDTLSKSPTPVSIVYVHGFTATRMEVHPLVDSLADRFGANVFYTRLTGHGRSPDAMKDASLKAWTQDVREALVLGRLIGERVVLVGTSTGGSLAAWAAAQPEYASSIAALVLVSPNLGPANAFAGLLDGPWGLQLARRIEGDRHTWEPANAAQRRWWTVSTAVEGLPVMMATVRLAEDVADAPLPMPVQVLSSTEDRVVNPAKIRRWFDRLDAPLKRLEDFGEVGDRSNHVLAGDILSPDETPVVLDLVTSFLRDAGLPEAGASDADRDGEIGDADGVESGG